MSSLRVAVLDYGIGNLRSAQKALEHVGADARLTADLAEIGAAGAVVMPGVGAFGACIDALGRSGLDGVARATIAEGRPFLGICVGMQMLCAGSDESPDHPGLGIFPERIQLIPGDVKRPQMQWNLLESVGSDHPMFAGMVDVWVYFVHSYAAEAGGHVIATCDYGGPVTAAMASGNVWATQFHPEKSGATGLSLLANFVAWAGAA